MKIKLFLGWFIACLLLGYVAVVLACDDCPDCPDCYTSTGEPPNCSCIYDCNEDDCESCVDDSCQVCGGDTNKTCCNGTCCETPVITSLSGPDTIKICEQADFSSSASDPDGTSLTYSWSGGGCPETGSSSTFTTKWPCKGDKTVSLTITDNDNPECCGSGDCCSDKTDSDSKDVEVTLPSGCSEGTKSASLQSQIVGTPTCPSGPCGATEMTGLSAAIEAKYNNCKWVFQVTALADVLSGACPSNYCNIVDGDEPCITEFNYCGIVWRFLYTDGCVSLGDFIPSSTPCVEIHEAKHYQMFVTELANQESILLTKASMSDMTIDCGDPTTTSCQVAKAARQSAIESDIADAYTAAWAVASDEVPPMAAAYLCFYFTADVICYYAHYVHGWKDCSYCPE